MIILNARTIPLVEKGLGLVREIGKHGYDALLAGGCVRDLVRWELGLEKHPGIHDVDIATNMPIDELRKAFRCESNNGEAHGTILVEWKNTMFEVTQFRKDGDYTDGRHPDSVEWAGSFEEDSARRDFTANAMGLDGDYRVVDYHGGVDSIMKNHLRTVGDATERFTEDALRIVRMCRFAARFGMEIDVATLNAARVLAPRLANISKERIHDELAKCAEYGVQQVAAMLGWMASWDIGKGTGLDIDWDFARQCLARLATVCSGIGSDVQWKPEYLFPLILPDKYAMERLKCTREDARNVEYVTEKFKKYLSGTLDLVDLVDLVTDDRWELFRAYVFSRQGYLVISRTDEIKLREHAAQWPTMKDMTKALLDAGVKQGKEFGHTLRKLRLAVYRHRKDNRKMTREWFDKLVGEIKAG